MSPSLQQDELQRARWRRAREALRLCDVSDEGFATGGLASHVPDLDARLVVLPADPEVDLLDFDERFWEWFGTQRQSPFGGQPVDWGNRRRSVADGAVRYTSDYKDPPRWLDYLGLTRCCGLDVGLSQIITPAREERPAVLLLTSLLGRFWSALDLYSEAAEDFKVGGPWELSIAIIGCRDAQLGGLATGWQPFFGFDSNTPVCLDDTCWLSLQLRSFPRGDDLRGLVFRIGGWVEDCWGSPQRRFIAKVGPNQGGFDSSRVR